MKYFELEHIFRNRLVCVVLAAITLDSPCAFCDANRNEVFNATRSSGTPVSRDNQMNGSNQYAMPLTVIQQFRESHQRDAVSALRDAYVKSRIKNEKQAIAAALISLGENDEELFRFLSNYAEQAIARDLPFPLALDTHGDFVKGKLSDDFRIWCTNHSENLENAIDYAMRFDPADVLFVSLAEHLRFVPLLHRALQSRNPLIAYYGAQGLARLHHGPAVAWIISSCENQPSQAAEVVARNLLAFGDKKAIASAERFIKNKSLLNDFEDQVKRGNTKFVFGE